MSQIYFDAAKISTLKWFENGFLPLNQSITETGRELCSELNELNVLDTFINYLNSHKKIKGLVLNNQEIKFIELEPGSEYIQVLEDAKLEYNNHLLDKLNIRIYICNHELGRRAKIVVSIYTKFGDHLTSQQVTQFGKEIFGIEGRIANFAKSILPERFNQYPGKIFIYACNVASFASNDDEIDRIIESKFDTRNTNFTGLTGSMQNSEEQLQKLLESYNVLLCGCASWEKINSKAILECLKNYGAQQSTIIVNRVNATIKTKTLNFEIKRDKHRVITSISNTRFVFPVNRLLVRDYLSLT